MTGSAEQGPCQISRPWHDHMTENQAAWLTVKLWYLRGRRVCGIETPLDSMLQLAPLRLESVVTIRKIPNQPEVLIQPRRSSLLSSASEVPVTNAVTSINRQAGKVSGKVCRPSSFALTARRNADYRGHLYTANSTCIVCHLRDLRYHHGSLC